MTKEIFEDDDKEQEEQQEQEQEQLEGQQYIPIPEAKLQQAVMTAYVTLRGLKPLLMSSTKEMHRDSIPNPIKMIKIRGSRIDPKFEAEKRSYRDKKGRLCVPARCIKRNLIEAIKLSTFETMEGKKVRGQISTMEKVKGSVSIVPENVLLIHTDGSPVLDYKVNAETVIIRTTGGRIMRYRPEIDDWGLRFQIKWNPFMYYVSEGLIRDLLEKGGYRGLLDNRPEYGIYECVEFRLDQDSMKLQQEMEDQGSKALEAKALSAKKAKQIQEEGMKAVARKEFGVDNLGEQQQQQDGGGDGPTNGKRKKATTTKKTRR